MRQLREGFEFLLHVAMHFSDTANMLLHIPLFITVSVLIHEVILMELKGYTVSPFPPFGSFSCCLRHMDGSNASEQYHKDDDVSHK